MIDRPSLVLAALLAAIPLAAARAQSVGHDRATPTSPRESTPEHEVPGDTGKAAPDAGAGEGSSLSDSLSRSGGVVTPPHTGDEQGVKTPPPSGRMPVIPPPGTSGNPRGVEPK